VNHLCVSTSIASEDDELITWATKNGLSFDRQNVDDIITRILGCARATKSTIVVRVWGDSPFVCPEVIDEMVARFRAEKLDYLTTSNLDSDTFPGGLDVEVYSLKLLREIDASTTDLKQREFPVEAIRKSPQKFKTGVITSEIDLSHLHISIDYPEDLVAARALLARLNPKLTTVKYSDIKRLHATDPSAFALFSKAPRNTEYTDYKKTLEQR